MLNSAGPGPGIWRDCEDFSLGICSLRLLTLVRYGDESCLKSSIQRMGQEDS